MEKEDMEVCRNHPEAQEIFKLAQLMTEAGYDFWSAVYCGSNLIGEDILDPDFEDISDEELEYILETQTGELIGDEMAPITVFLGGGRDGMTLLDMRPARGKACPTEADGELHKNLTAEQAMEIIKEFFEEQKA